jgi:hypothetical protein
MQTAALREKNPFPPRPNLQVNAALMLFTEFRRASHTVIISSLIHQRGEVGIGRQQCVAQWLQTLIGIIHNIFPGRCQSRFASVI